MNAPATPNLETLLVPTDLSAESLKAIDYAQALLRESGGVLHLLHVHEMEADYAMPAAMTMPPVQMSQEMERAALEELQRLAERRGVEAGAVHTKVGRAFDQICRTAAELGADLIVLTTHGHTGLKHLFLGSTAEQVVQHSPCPVLVVRRQEEREFVDAGKPHIARIVVPVDFSDCSRCGLDYAIAFAQKRGATLVLLHAYEPVPFMPTERFPNYGDLPSVEVIESAAREQIAKLVQETDFRGVPHEVKVQLGRPADEICRCAEETNADLVITSTHGHTGLAHVLIGSTAEHVVRRSHCPVLVVPQRAATSSS
jgi:nucleotide-binding universal stress UspA family protein